MRRHRPFSRTARNVVRDFVPGAARLHRAWTNRVYSRSPTARLRLFTSYARDNLWGDPETISGPNSSLAQTRTIRDELPKLWVELDIRRLADIPCGDFFWMALIAEQLDYYFGGDLVPEVVESARERARELRMTRCEFRVFDLLDDSFPPVDAILVRDILDILSDRDVGAILGNIARSSARYFITTTYPEARPKDITTGVWRPLNLSAAPFSLPEPVRLIHERNTHSGQFMDKHLAVWEVAQLRSTG